MARSNVKLGDFNVSFLELGFVEISGRGKLLTLALKVSNEYAMLRNHGDLYRALRDYSVNEAANNSVIERYFTECGVASIPPQ